MAKLPKLPNFNSIGKSLLRNVKEYSPEILTGIGLISLLTSTVMAVKVTPTAAKKLEEKKKELNVDKLDPVDVVRTVWVDYIPVAIPVVTGSACIIGGGVMRYKKNLGLAAMLGASEATLTKYKDKVIEEIGEKKEAKIEEKMCQDEIDKCPLSNSRYHIYETGYGNMLFFDPLYVNDGGYFHHDLEVMRRQTAELNLDGFSQGGVSLNEWRLAVGLKPIDPDIGNYLGWTEKFDIDPIYGSADDGAPCGYLRWTVKPTWDYYKIH